MFERYSEEACQSHLENSIGYAEIEVLAVQDLMSWDWVVDGVSITIYDAYVVEAELTLTNGDEFASELHYALMDGELRWFTICGDPAP